jgi:hypothetical protein
VRRAAIEEQNRDLLARQRDFRIAADVVCDAWASFAEVQAVAVVGSVAKTLWKAVPRFREFRRQGIEVWHECADLDLALWLDLQQRLGDLRRSAEKVLRAAYEAGVGISVVGRQLDVFLIEPASDCNLGRLRHFCACPKGKRECRVPGCGARVPGPRLRRDAVQPALREFHARVTVMGWTAPRRHQACQDGCCHKPI